MTLAIEAIPVPLEMDADGVMRVGGTRVTLDTVVYAFRDGATPEEIAQQYPALPISDIYAVITYYLWRRHEVDIYLQTRERLATTVRQENEVRWNPAGIRARLLARRGT